MWLVRVHVPRDVTWRLKERAQGKMEASSTTRSSQFPITKDFTFTFRSNGAGYRLRVPVQLPYKGNTRELVLRVIRAHNLPCYLEDELCGQLERFIRDAALEMWDTEAEERMFGGSVFVKVARMEYYCDSVGKEGCTN